MALQQITLKVTGTSLVPVTTIQWQELSWYLFVLGVGQAGVYRTALWKAGTQGRSSFNSTSDGKEKNYSF